MARKAAQGAEASLMRGEKMGPLSGVPVSVKDLTPTAGIRTTFGSKIFEHSVPTEDGLMIERLKKAGAIVLGKTNTPSSVPVPIPITPFSGPPAIHMISAVPVADPAEDRPLLWPAVSGRWRRE